MLRELGLSCKPNARLSAICAFVSQQQNNQGRVKRKTAAHLMQSARVWQKYVTERRRHRVSKRAYHNLNELGYMSMVQLLEYLDLALEIVQQLWREDGTRNCLDRNLGVSILAPDKGGALSRHRTTRRSSSRSKDRANDQLELSETLRCAPGGIPDTQWQRIPSQSLPR